MHDCSLKAGSLGIESKRKPEKKRTPQWIAAWRLGSDPLSPKPSSLQIVTGWGRAEKPGGRGV